jgi:DeoR family transcriptional regulator, aga operon transcriptional repressor
MTLSGPGNFLRWTNESKRYKKKAVTQGLKGFSRALLTTSNECLIVLNEERRRAILEILNRQGRVLVTELAGHFETSQVTIRKDLEVLHEHRHLHRTHGGALPARDGALEDPTLREKEQLHRKDKLHIATAAARMVKEGQVVILDSGTTTTAIARALRDLRNLTIITNALNIAGELAGTTIDVILTGGTLRKNSFSLVGPIAEETLRHLSADLLFLGVDGFDVQHGLSTPNLLESKVNRVMVEIAKRTVAVCDSSKFGRRSLSMIVPTSSMHEVITDRDIPKSDLRGLRKAGIEVTLV